METNNLLFSIIIPLYNKENNIRQTVISVLSQTYSYFEIIIVDDGSTDNSARIVKSINDSRIKYFFKKNGGVSSARNYGITRANYDWILFLDADDKLLPNALENIKKAYLSSNRYIDIIAGNYAIKKKKEKKYITPDHIAE